MKKRLSLSILILSFFALVTGCQKNDFKQVIDKMTLSDSMVGYNAVINLSGTANGNQVDDRVYVTNYMDSDISISYNLTDGEDKEIYYSNNQFYVKNNEEFELSTDRSPYINTKIYVDILNNALKIKKDKDSIIDNVKYSVFEYELDNTTVKSLLKETSVGEIDSSAIGKIYIDSNGYIYSNTINIDNLELNIIYNNYNSTSKLNIGNFRTRKALKS